MRQTSRHCLQSRRITRLVHEHVAYAMANVDDVMKGVSNFQRARGQELLDKDGTAASSRPGKATSSATLSIRIDGWIRGRILNQWRIVYLTYKPESKTKQPTNPRCGDEFRKRRIDGERPGRPAPRFVRRWPATLIRAGPCRTSSRIDRRTVWQRQTSRGVTLSLIPGRHQCSCSSTTTTPLAS